MTFRNDWQSGTTYALDDAVTYGGETWLSLTNGNTAFVPETAAFDENMTYPDIASNRIKLSEREISVLRLMAGGYANRDIARTLFLAEGTVKNYVSDILTKLKARDRTQAVLKAIRCRLI